ncbi:MAG TPA: histidine phosphatase family protein, partial [Kofleriaceae bacterium]|nr:histidine phosphatase family protein [Kofleriaceae bacterium]
RPRRMKTKTKTTLVLARHGLTDWNVERRYQGHLDPPLNETGRTQARDLAARLAAMDLAAIYASDLARAFETASIVASTRRLPVTPERGLREVDVGSWSGLTRDEIARRFPEPRRHDGETEDALFTRVHDAVVRIARAHHGQTILIVSHGASLRLLRRRVLRLETAAPLANCETYTLLFDGQFRER